MPKITVNDINMYYELRGEGKPLVLITGLGNDIFVYGTIIGRLSKKFKVLAFDNRGAGRTDKPDMPYSIEMMADDTAGLMDALGIKQAHIIGISMGGRIAMALCLQHPGMVNSLILASTFARQSASLPKIVRSGRIERIPVIGKIFSKFVQPDYAFQRQLKASRSYDCSGRLDMITVPTLIMHGTGDTLAPVELAEEMHAGIKGSKMITFEGGHAFFMNMQAEFCSAISHFLMSLEK